MNNHLFLNDEDWAIFIDILLEYNCRVYAFGSRVKGNHTRFSDIDLYIVGDIDMNALKEQFEESDLTVKVDLKHCNELSSEFMDLVKNDLVLVKDCHTDAMR